MTLKIMHRNWNLQTNWQCDKRNTEMCILNDFFTVNWKSTVWKSKNPKLELHEKNSFFCLQCFALSERVNPVKFSISRASHACLEISSKLSETESEFKWNWYAFLLLGNDCLGDFNLDGERVLLWPLRSEFSMKERARREGGGDEHTCAWMVSSVHERAFQSRLRVCEGIQPSAHRDSPPNQGSMSCEDQSFSPW